MLAHANFAISSHKSGLLAST